MKLSCLCCTESRPKFMGWLEFVYNQLEWEGEKELVVVDSTPEKKREEVECAIRAGVPAGELHYHYHPKPGCTIAEKSNIALDKADGELLTWLDDDDWTSPRAVTQAFELMNEDIDVVKARLRFPFINLHMMMVRYVPTFMWSLGLYRTEAVRGIRFVERTKKGPMLIGQDTTWQGHVWQRVPQRRQTILRQEWLGCALSHDRNIANSCGGNKPFQWKYPIPPCPSSVKPEEWDLVLLEIEVLRRKLGFV